MTMEAIGLIVIVILLVGVSAYCTFLDYKHYNPYTEVVVLNNNSFIVETRFISNLDRMETGEPSLLSGTSHILYEKFRNEVMRAAMKEKPRESKTYFLVNAHGAACGCQLWGAVFARPVPAIPQRRGTTDGV